MFMLSLTTINTILKKVRRKQDAIIINGSNYVKMIFAPMAKPTAIQVQFSRIQVGKPGFKKLFPKIYYCRGYKSC